MCFLAICPAGSVKVLSVELRLDAVTLLTPDTPLASVARTLEQALGRQLNAMVDCITKHSQVGALI